MRRVADQGLGELEQPAGVLLAPTRLVARRIEVGDDLGHHQHDDQVDDQGEPVRRGVDGQVAVGGEEEDVVEDEADHRGQGARP